MHKTGNMYYYRPGNEYYLLAQVLGGKACLINIENGNRAYDPIDVKNTRNITNEELEKMVHNDGYDSYKLSDYVLVNEVEITAKINRSSTQYKMKEPE